MFYYLNLKMEILHKAHFYNNQFIVYGHRGVPELCPENTIESFEKAIELNYSGIELDVMQTKDKILIVHHDTVINFNNKKENINQLEYSALLETLPSLSTLENVLDSVGHKTNINIEIKNQGAGSSYAVNQTIRSLKKLNLIDNVIISSFNPWIIKESKKIDDRFITAWILGEKNIRFFSLWRPLLQYFKMDAIHINHRCVNKKIIEKIHSYNMKVIAYTVNSEVALKSLIAKKIDGVFTDSPKILQISKNLIP